MFFLKHKIWIMDTFNSGRFSGLFSSPYFSPPVTGSNKINVGTAERIISGAGGLMLSYWGYKNKNFLGVLAASAGSALLYRSTLGYCPVNEALGRDTSGREDAVVEVSTSVIINQPREFLYSYWRRLENLPNFMQHLEEVTQTSDDISLWVARIPGGIGDVEWEAEIIREEEGHLLAWQSLPGSEIDNAGEVRFEDAPGGKTLVETTIIYRPPVGELGELAGKIFTPAFEKLIKKDLRGFKKFMESGGYESYIKDPWEEEIF